MGGLRQSNRKERNIITSLELQSEVMEKINQRLQAKYKALEENEVRYEAINCDDADYVIVAFGSSARICSATVELLVRAEGRSAPSDHALSFPEQGNCRLGKTRCEAS